MCVDQPSDETREDVDPAEARWEKLMAAWPELFYYRFRGRRLQPIKAWGIECGPGWHDLLVRLFTEMAAEAQRLGLPPPRITQIKEKFGDLRVHIGFPRRRIVPLEFLAIIDRYSKESRSTCEVCGAPGRLFQDSYWVTRCEDHRSFAA